MQELMNMNQYGGRGGGGGRGWGGAPQPQRPNNRRNQRGGGGGPGLGGPQGAQFRGGNSRFEHNQNNRPQQQVKQPAGGPAEVKPAAAASPAGVQGVQAAQTPAQVKPDVKPEEKPVTIQQTPNKPNQPPVQNPVSEPAAAAQQSPALNKNNAQQNSQPPVQSQQNSQPLVQNQQTNNGPQNLNQNSGPNQQNKRRGGPGNYSGGPGGNFGGPANKPQGSGAQGGNFAGAGNKQQGGNFGPPNKQGGGGNFGPANKQGGGNFNQGNRQGGPNNMGGGGPPRNQRGGPRDGRQDGKQGGPPHGPREEQMLAAKLKDLVGPLTDLPPLEQTEVKFNGRSRLYIGNLSNEITEEEIQQLFATYGETSELFVNKEKNFAFIRMDYRANAEKAKRELDCSLRRGRPLRVRFAPHNSAIRVKNLTPFVTNELLYCAFEIFGKIERAYVKVDERGKSLGEGVVEFARKPSALAAIRNCTEKCFFLTSSLRPVIVENFEEPDEFDGYQEKNLPKKHPDYLRSREVGPRFSELNSFEHEYGTRWKQLHELFRQKEEALKTERANEEDKLEAQMEYAKYEHETELLREQLRQREQDRERQKRTWEIAERAAEERREQERLSLVRQEEELAVRMRHQDDELRRRQQENTLFVQAQRLNSMLDRQEGMFDNSHPQKNLDGGYMDQYDMGRGYDDGMGGGGGSGGGGVQHWEGGRHQDDFPNKRRRF